MVAIISSLSSSAFKPKGELKWSQTFAMCPKCENSMLGQSILRKFKCKKCGIEYTYGEYNKLKR